MSEKKEVFSGPANEKPRLTREKIRKDLSRAVGSELWPCLIGAALCALLGVWALAAPVRGVPTAVNWVAYALIAGTVIGFCGRAIYFLALSVRIKRLDFQIRKEELRDVGVCETVARVFFPRLFARHRRRVEFVRSGMLTVDFRYAPKEYEIGEEFLLVAVKKKIMPVFYRAESWDLGDLF